MRKYYTRPCNFYYGIEAKKILKNKKALPIAGNQNIAFDKVEVFERIKKGVVKTQLYKLQDIKNLNKHKKLVVTNDLKKVTSKRKKYLHLDFDSPKIMGVLNVTPDSFSDGGLYFDDSKAFQQASLIIKSGASIIDIGGESTRPGSQTVNVDEEWKRIKKVIIKLKKKFPKMLLSLDSRKSQVMKKGIKEGIDIINHVSGLNFDKESFNVVKSNRMHFILHHMQGTPNTMQNNPK